MNYLFGWNAVSEFIVDELSGDGIDIQAVIVDDAYAEMKPSHCEFTVLALKEVKFKSGDSVINCLGYRNLNRRIEVGEYLKAAGVLKSFVSKESKIYRGCEIGQGTVFVGNVVIERFANIGEHCLFWGGSRICHNSRVGRGVFIASGAIIGGYCEIGDSVSIGFNSSVKEGSALIAGTKVGANNFQSSNKKTS